MKKVLLFIALAPLCVFGQTWTRYNTINGILKDNHVSSIYIDRYGAKWIGTSHGLDICNNGGNWSYLFTNSSFSNYIISALSGSANGDVWAATLGDGLIPVQSNSSLGSLNLSNSSIPSNFIYSIDAQDPNSIWFGMEDEVAKIVNPNSFVKYNQTNSPIKNCITKSVYASIGGDKWFGTDKLGLIKLSGTTFTVYDSTNSSLPSNSINCVTMDKLGNVWVGTDKGLAILDKTGKWNVFTVSNSPIPNNKVQCFAFSKDSSAWIGTRFGLAHLSKGIWYGYHYDPFYSNSLPEDNVTALAVDSKGNIWVGTNEQGAAMFTLPVASAISVPEHDAPLNFYPNPVKDISILKYPFPSSTHTAVLNIYDIQGSLKSSVSLDVHSSSTSISSEALNNGVYFCDLLVDGVSAVKTKFVVLK